MSNTPDMPETPESPYGYLILMAPNSNLSLPGLTSALRERLKNRPEYRVLHMGRSMAVIRDNWQLWLLYNDAPSVLEESLDIMYEAPNDRRELIALSASRLEMGSDPDPDGVHYEDAQDVLGVIESFSGVNIYDLKEECFFNFTP